MPHLRARQGIRLVTVIRAILQDLGCDEPDWREWWVSFVALAAAVIIVWLGMVLATS